ALGSDQEATAPPDMLTPREREVVALVASGRSNRAIAEELFISPATAARHVANILAKLGFNSRGQIAAWAADRPPHISDPGADPPPGREAGAPGGRAGGAPVSSHRPRAGAVTWVSSGAPASRRLSMVWCGAAGSAASRMLAANALKSASFAVSRPDPRVVSRRCRGAPAGPAPIRRTGLPPSSPPPRPPPPASSVCRVNP